MKPGTSRIAATAASCRVASALVQPLNRTFAPLQALVDELVRCGMRHAVTCPGSRNAPLILALAEREELRCVSVIDERSAGFLALGLARASGRPVVVTCTSGTAAANLHPAVAEAGQGSVPLIVLTADRPPELRDVGAGQSIDQLGLYGTAVKWFAEVGSHEPSRGTAVHHRALGCRAYATAAGGRPGPVHLNFPLREPLAPLPEPLEAGDWQGRRGGRPWIDVRPPHAGLAGGDAAGLAQRLGEATRGVIVCGETPEPVAEPVTRLAAALGWPVLADPPSGVRCGPHDRSHVVAHYDVLLRVEPFARERRPDLVLRVGVPPVSQSLRGWLGTCPQVALDPHATWHDPTRAVEQVLTASPAAALAALAEQVQGAAEPDWLGSWRRADELVRAALGASAEPFEGLAAAALEPALPPDALVWLSYSMPVRDVEAFFPACPKPLRFLAGRGANGIDGVVSAAAGAALGSGRPTFVLIGDVALIHDLGGLVSARRAGATLTVVCLNNDGGGIFDFLPVASHAEPRVYERHVATPHGTDMAAVAALAGLEHRTAATAAELGAALGAPGLVEMRSDRRANVGLHAAVVERLAAALEGR
jgi:2-succinyl-5-enolpyruvyl-6-hydroxy-3-cyclohexene-1-carboxylate synthase